MKNQLFNYGNQIVDMLDIEYADATKKCANHIEITHSGHQTYDLSGYLCHKILKGFMIP